MLKLLLKIFIPCVSGYGLMNLGFNMTDNPVIIWLLLLSVVSFYIFTISRIMDYESIQNGNYF